MNTRHTISFQP